MRISSSVMLAGKRIDIWSIDQGLSFNKILAMKKWKKPLDLDKFPKDLDLMLMYECFQVAEIQKDFLGMTGFAL